MKFRRYVTRCASGSGFRSLSGLVGARQNLLTQYSDRRFRPYEGPFSEHVMMLVREGSVVFDHDDFHFEARAGDALLIGRGDAGRLSFGRCPVNEGLVVEVLTFDERSIAKALRNNEGWETLALWEQGEARNAFALPGFHNRAPKDPKYQHPGSHRLHAAINVLLEQYRAGLGGFLRENFYLPRWRLCIFLEQFVIPFQGAKDAGLKYAGGPNQLRNDCLLYLGAKPERILARRRAELATAWLRCENSIDDVAKALGFPSRWEFECFYAGMKHQRCRDVQKLTPLSKAEPEELISAIRPCWWAGDRKLSIEIPPAKDPYTNPRCEKDDEPIAGDGPGRAELTKELRTKAEDFCAMKSTGAKMIVPIFEFQKPMDEAA